MQFTNHSVYQCPTIEELQKDFGIWVQNIRTLRGMRQKELADRLKLSRTLYQGDISLIEQGKKGIDPEIMVGICQALEVSPREFNEMINMVLCRHL